MFLCKVTGALRSMTAAEEGPASGSAGGMEGGAGQADASHASASASASASAPSAVYTVALQGREVCFSSTTPLAARGGAGAGAGGSAAPSAAQPSEGLGASGTRAPAPSLIKPSAALSSRHRMRTPGPVVSPEGLIFVANTR
jgi:hypothetical protein